MCAGQFVCRLRQFLRGKRAYVPASGDDLELLSDRRPSAPTAQEALAVMAHAPKGAALLNPVRRVLRAECNFYVSNLVRPFIAKAGHAVLASANPAIRPLSRPHPAIEPLWKSYLPALAPRLSRLSLICIKVRRAPSLSKCPPIVKSQSVLQAAAVNALRVSLKKFGVLCLGHGAA